MDISKIVSKDEPHLYSTSKELSLPADYEPCRTTGERVEFTVRTSSDGKIAVNAWCYEGERVQKYIPRIIRAIEAEDFEGISELKYHPKEFVVRADPLREEEFRAIKSRSSKNKQ